MTTGGMTMTFEVGDPNTRRTEFQGWLCANGIDPNVTYRVDIDADAITVHQYKRGEDGGFYVENGDIALESPRRVPRATLRRPWFSEPMALPVPIPVAR